jgi:hypothetical protein
LGGLLVRFFRKPSLNYSLNLWQQLAYEGPVRRDLSEALLDFVPEPQIKTSDCVEILAVRET